MTVGHVIPEHVETRLVAACVALRTVPRGHSVDGLPRALDPPKFRDACAYWSARRFGKFRRNNYELTNATACPTAIIT